MLPPCLTQHLPCGENRHGRKGKMLCITIPATMQSCTGAVMTLDPTEQGLATSYFPRVGVNMNGSQGAAVKVVHTTIPSIFRSRG